MLDVHEYIIHHLEFENLENNSGRVDVVLIKQRTCSSL